MPGSYVVTSGNAVASIVGCVLDFQRNCGPGWQLLKCGVGNLVTVKFQFQLGKHEKTAFVAEFDDALENLKQLQADTVRISTILRQWAEPQLCAFWEAYSRKEYVPPSLAPESEMVGNKKHDINNYNKQRS